MNPFLFGFLGLLVLYLFSFLVTKSISPLALAKGKNGNLSTSLFQFLVFTGITIFAYVSVFASRAMAGFLQSLPEIPVNLLILMGLSVTTASSSKGITISYLKQGELKAEQDNSDLVMNREGATDLSKVQMLVWTLIAAVIYAFRIVVFIRHQEYKLDTEIFLPDIDGSLLVLMGASQGGYVAGKLVSRTAAPPAIDHILPSQVQQGQEVAVEGNFFGDKEGNILILKEKATSTELKIPGSDIQDWSETRITFQVPTGLKQGAYLLIVRVNGRSSTPMEFEIIP